MSLSTSWRHLSDLQSLARKRSPVPVRNGSWRPAACTGAWARNFVTGTQISGGYFGMAFSALPCRERCFK